MRKTPFGTKSSTLTFSSCGDPCTSVNHRRGDHKPFRPALREDIALKAVSVESKATPIRLARQVVGSSNIASQVLATKTALRLQLIEPHAQCLYPYRTLTTQGVMHITPHLPFSVTMSNFSDSAQYLPKHMVVASTEHATPTIFNCRRIPANLVAIGTPRIVNPEYHRRRG